MSTILIVDDKEGVRRSLEIVLQKEGFRVASAPDGGRALIMIRELKPDVIVTDMRMEPMSGIELLQRVKEQRPQTEVILMTAYATIDSAVMAIKLGAFDYITKPFKHAQIIAKIKDALAKGKQQVEASPVPQARVSHGRQALSGCSAHIRTILAQITRVGPTDLTVLVTGETGTGKSLVAKLIHNNSCRASGPFVSINCAAVPESLLESELFGHEKGAFTGAVQSRKGLFEEADTGTLFLDEIGTLPLSMQAKLLGVLQDREVRRIGKNRSITVDVRVIAATNVDLEQAVKRGTFREDLFYRLNVARIHIPPLREHREDIPELVDCFLSEHSRRDGRVYRISPEAMELLRRYDYPGNIRELENALAWAVAITPGELITPAELPETIRFSHMIARRVEETGHSKVLEEIEKNAIRETIARCGGNLTKAAKELGIGRTTLWRKLRDYHLKVE